MKKFTILFAMLLMNITAFAQNKSTDFFIEDFSSGVPPTGWSIDNEPDNWSESDTDIAGGESPEVKLRWVFDTNTTHLISPNIDLTGVSSVVLSFKHTMADYTGLGYTLGAATRSGGSSWNEVWELTTTGNLTQEIKDVFIDNIDVGTSDFQVSVFLRGNGNTLCDWYIDDVNLYLQDNSDVQMVSINMPKFIEASNINVSCTIKNKGLNEITSLDINYRVNGDDTVMQSLNGLSLASLESINFIFDTIWGATPGTYDIKVWVSNVNGASDDDQSNNLQNHFISIASGFTANLPLFEVFTSSTCGPCEPFNTNVINPFMQAHPDDIAVIKYQMYWPAPGDPYFTEEGGVRKNFYGVNAIPFLLGGGINLAINTEALNTSYAFQNVKHSFFNVEAVFDTNSDIINVSVDITPYVTATVNVQIVVIEKHTTENVGTNGETNFEHVMMKMLPDASGTNVNFVADSETNISESFDMSSTFVEEMDDLAVVVLIQDIDTKEILQASFVRNEILRIDDNQLSNVYFYPNPSSKELYIVTDKELQISIYDVLGKKVHFSNIISNKTLDISNLQNGVYLVKLSKGVHATINKLIVNK